MIGAVTTAAAPASKPLRIPRRFRFGSSGMKYFTLIQAADLLWMSIQIDPNTLRLCIKIDRRFAKLSSKSGCFEAAEGKRVIGRRDRVYPNCAGFDASGKAMSFFNIARPDRSGKPE